MAMGLWNLGTDVVRIIAEYWAETEEECLALEAVSDAHTARVIDGFPWTVSKFMRWVAESSSSNDMFEKHRVGLLRLASITCYPGGSRQVHIWPSIRSGKVVYAVYTDWQRSNAHHLGPTDLLYSMQQLKLL